jgi:hypothetical protein
MNFLSEELNQVAKVAADLGNAHAAEAIIRSCKRLESAYAQGTTEVEAYFDRHVSPESLQCIRQWTAAGEESTPSWKTRERMTLPQEPAVLGEYVSPVLVAALSPDSFRDPVYTEKLEQLFSMRALVILPLADTETVRRVRRFCEAPVLLNLPQEKLEQRSLSQLLTLIFTECGDDLLTEFTATLALQVLTSFAHETAKGEDRLMNQKKQLQGVLAGDTRNDPSRAITDLIRNIDRSLQSKFDAFEDELSRKYTELNKINVGEFHFISLSLADGLSDFDQEENYEKFEKIRIRPAPEFEENTLHAVRSVLDGSFRNDIQNLNDQISEMEMDIAGKLKGFNLKPIPEGGPVKIHTARIFESVVAFNKKFTGELTPKGIKEYFIALRDYTTLISTVVGILMPLMMLLAGYEILIEAFDEKKDRVETPAEEARRKKEEEGMSKWERMSSAQQGRLVLGVITGVITVIMIVYGVFSLSKRIPKQREEMFNSEISKARLLISAECKRMFEESTREFRTLVERLTEDKRKQLMILVEESVNFRNMEHAAVRGNSEKEKLWLENTLRKAQNSERAFDRSSSGVASRLRDSRSKLRDKESTILKLLEA